MTFDLTLLLVMIVSGLEVFTGIISKPLDKIINNDKKNSKEGKLNTTIKLIFVILFLVSTIYFLYKGVYVLGNWLGIPMDKNILDVIRNLVK